MEDNNNLWDKIRDYIVQMEQYYTNNQLIINVKKTIVMIISNNKELKQKEITINGNTIRNNNEITILGTKLNNNLNWNTHFREGNKALLLNLKRRATMIKSACYKMGGKFTKQMAQALFYGKLLYHIEVIGKTNKQNIDKIDKMIVSIARKISQYIAGSIVLRSRMFGDTIRIFMHYIFFSTVIHNTICKFANTVLNEIVLTQFVHSYQYNAMCILLHYLGGTQQVVSLLLF